MSNLIILFLMLQCLWLLFLSSCYRSLSRKLEEQRKMGWNDEMRIGELHKKLFAIEDCLEPFRSQIWSEKRLAATGDALDAIAKATEYLTILGNLKS